jgi:thiol-disulfide isomerase/thioredoxin
MKINWYKLSVLLIILLAFIGVLSCTSEKPQAESTPPTSGQAGTPAWMEIELTDVATGETFKISDFKGKPILLESFAVWCPTCLAQQKEVKKVKQTEGENIIHISLDTDPNEDERKVREHIEINELDWYFAVSPVELTQALIDEFGLSFVSAPRAPVVLICEEQSTRFLRSGVKSAEELISEVEEGCQ